ncbi:hypothetical protein, partial [Klebsiella variicola]|uniref:hypothetical protein n=1 Tax=Klebsiella variicola TaxID=244366 RepID=UPI001ABD3B73
CVEQDDKGRDARKRAYCLKIQPATGSFARNLIYSTKPCRDFTISIETHNTRGKQVFLIKWIVHETAIHLRLLFKEIVVPGHPKSFVWHITHVDLPSFLTLRCAIKGTAWIPTSSWQ